MWRRSPLKNKKEEFFSVYEYIIGDTAFDPSENMVPAYKANPGFNEPEDLDESLLNKVISKPRVSSEHVNGMWKGRFPWLRMIPNRIKDKKSLKDILKYIHCTVILHNLLIEFGDMHMESWAREEDRLSDIANPDRAPSDEMIQEERMLYSRVPTNAPKDWRRETLKQYLREQHAIFEEQRNARRIFEGDDDDVVMEDNHAIEAQFEKYFYSCNNK
jgi:hypothetical protein